MESKYTMREHAFNALRDDIISGALSPGERILEEVIAERYNVSRTPLREALLQLEQEGLLERFSKRGMTVTGLSLKEVSELYEVRARLEGLAAWHATDNLDDVSRDELQKKYDASYRYDPSVREMVMCDEMPWIHEFILEHSNHAICTDYLHRLKIHLDRYKRMTKVNRKDKKQVHLEHSLIIGCMLARDQNGAEMAMQAHVKSACCIAKKIISTKIN